MTTDLRTVGQSECDLILTLTLTLILPLTSALTCGPWSANRIPRLIPVSIAVSPATHNRPVYWSLWLIERRGWLSYPADIWRVGNVGRRRHLLTDEKTGAGRQLHERHTSQLCTRQPTKLHMTNAVNNWLLRPPASKTLRPVIRRLTQELREKKKRIFRNAGPAFIFLPPNARWRIWRPRQASYDAKLTL